MDALIASHAEELTKEELEAIIEVSEEEEAGNDDDEEEVSRSNVTVKLLGEMLQNMRSIIERLSDADPVMERYFKFKRGLDDVMLPCKKLRQNLRQSARQLTITNFLCPSPSTPGESAPSPASPASPPLLPLR